MKLSLLTLIAGFGATAAFHVAVPQSIPCRATRTPMHVTFLSTIDTDTNSESSSTEGLTPDEITALELKNQEMTVRSSEAHDVLFRTKCHYLNLYMHTYTPIPDLCLATLH